MKIRILLTLIMAAAGWAQIAACTSMVVSARASASGRPMLWKHRDCSAELSFIERSEATDSTLAFVALYNAGDSTLSDAWTGMNSAGFAIMNTASYNLAPDTASYADREGAVMRAALERCHTVADFEQLLADMQRPRGVQANFGVIDAQGGACYFEVNDHEMWRYDCADTPDGVLVRTNFSISKGREGGLGYIRYDNACTLSRPYIESGTLSPLVLTDTLSRSFYQSLIGRDMSDTADRWLADQDFIPRYSSSASIVIEGVDTDDNAADCIMWAALGYPPVAVTRRVTLEELPAELRPMLPGWISSDAAAALERKRLAFPVRNSEARYIDLHYLQTLWKTTNN